MDEPTDTTNDPSLHRQFKLTPLPKDETTDAAPRGGGQKWGRRLLLGGAVVTPVVVTVRSRRALAANCTMSNGGMGKISVSGGVASCGPH